MQFIALTKNPQCSFCNGQGGKIKMRCHVFLDLTYIWYNFTARSGRYKGEPPHHNAPVSAGFWSQKVTSGEDLPGTIGQAPRFGSFPQTAICSWLFRLGDDARNCGRKVALSRHSLAWGLKISQIGPIVYKSNFPCIENFNFDTHLVFGQPWRNSR